MNLSIEFTRRGLVKSNVFFHPGSPDGIQHSKDTNTVGICRILGHVEGNLYVTHRSKVVNFAWLDLGDDGNKIRSIAQVTIMKEQLYTCLVAILVDMVDASRVETRRTTDETVDLRSTESIIGHYKMRIKTTKQFMENRLIGMGEIGMAMAIAIAIAVSSTRRDATKNST